MKSRLTVSFGGVADRERKHLGKKVSGIKGAWAPGRRIDRAFLGQLAFGSSTRAEDRLGVPGLAGWLLGLVLLGLLGWVDWLGKPSLGPWYPQFGETNVL